MLGLGLLPLLWLTLLQEVVLAMRVQGQVCSMQHLPRHRSSQSSSSSRQDNFPQRLQLQGLPVRQQQLRHRVQRAVPLRQLVWVQ
jgi:hypothetical protein